MESKLPIYQLAAPCTSCQGLNGIKNWNWSADNILHRFNQAVGAVGSVSNLINSFKNGTPINVDGKTLSEEDRKFFYQMALQSQNAGGGQAGNEAIMQFLLQNQQMMNQYMMNQNAANNNNNNPEPKDNTTLYVGLGIGGVIVIAMIMLMMSKK